MCPPSRLRPPGSAHPETERIGSCIVDPHYFRFLTTSDCSPLQKPTPLQIRVSTQILFTNSFCFPSVSLSNWKFVLCQFFPLHFPCFPCAVETLSNPSSLQIPQNFGSFTTSGLSSLQIPGHFRSLTTSDPSSLQFPHIFSSLASLDTSPL